MDSPGDKQDVSFVSLVDLMIDVIFNDLKPPGYVDIIKKTLMTFNINIRKLHSTTCSPVLKKAFDILIEKNINASVNILKLQSKEHVH